MAKLIPLPEYAPDISALGTGVSPLIQGVTPRADGYGPFKSVVELTSSLPSGCRGVYRAYSPDPIDPTNSGFRIIVFAGTSTRLYKLETNLTWTDVSKGGVAYTALPSGSNWQFEKFNDLLIAVQPNTVPQKFLLASDTQFSNLAGSPPAAKFIAIVGRFVMLTGLTSNVRRAHWSDLDAPETWTAGVGLADFQDMPDGGQTLGIAGGDAYGILFQQSSIRSLIYAPGSPVVFQIVRISTQDTIYASYSIINIGTRIFFISALGFKVIENGGEPRQIGKERVDRTFFDSVDKTNLQLVIGANDPAGTRAMWAYKSAVGGTTGLFDTILCYDWSIGKNGEWSKIPLVGEWLFSTVTPSITNDFDIKLASFTSAHKMGLHTSTNIEAVLETDEQDLEGQLVFVQAVRPLTDCATAAVSIGCRIGPADTVSYTAESTVDNQGYAGILVETRYARARVRIPAGTTWTYCRGVQPEAVPAGDT